MNRLTELMKNKEKNILSIFFTAGYPKLESTVQIIEALNASGVDLVEIGIPFSDPIADGPTIQTSSSKALLNGMSLKLLLNQIKDARKKVKEMPFILMGYLNPIIKYGVEAFFRDANEAGVDALILPDLPFDEYLYDFKELSRNYNLPIIMLITPETSEDRIRHIDNNSEGFIYMVSAASTTGAKDKFSQEQIKYFKRINSLSLKNKRLIGFGISNRQTLDQAFENASGAIIGSHFIKCLDACCGDEKKAAAMLLDSLNK